MKRFARPLRVNVTYGRSCRRAHCHSASSSSSLDIPTSHPHRKFVRGKARVKVKSKTLEFWSSIAAHCAEDEQQYWDGMGWWFTIVGNSPQVKMLQQYSPSLHHMQTLQCDSSLLIRGLLCLYCTQLFSRSNDFHIF